MKPYPPIMTKPPLTLPEIITHLAALTEQLKRSTNDSERRTLLREFRILLGRADTSIRCDDEAETSES